MSFVCCKSLSKVFLYLLPSDTEDSLECVSVDPKNGDVIPEGVKVFTSFIMAEKASRRKQKTVENAAEKASSHVFNSRILEADYL